MTRLKTLLPALFLFGALACSAAAHAAGTASAPTTFALGTLTAPLTSSYENSFQAPTAVSFYDDFVFNLSQVASLSSVTATIDLGQFFGINNISARLYQGIGPFSPATATLMQAWSTPFSANGLTGSTTVLSLASLAAATYTLEIRGNVIGTFGGSYSGVLNVSPVPEPTNYGMLLMGAAAMLLVARKKSGKA
ncbi:hypothetical protein RCH09_002688 [Actimicrobium sp. GrIS 1.19]|uniref:FxDxF family PEP-CTERM protein n=1 Tax=Actimicrobium sp. GrIS 1.19 TaxID=3071708 RepID=UPI002E03AA4F|nr:hypothetical protein [Actimicrobium sp. GrIS 1.19]